MPQIITEAQMSNAWVRENDQASRLASTADITTGLQLGRAEVLRGLNNFLNKDRSEYCSSECLKELLLLVGCLTSQQHESASLGRICSDNFTCCHIEIEVADKTCCHTETEVADQTFHLTQSQYTDTGPTSPSADPIRPRAWQGSQRSANFEVTGMTRPRKNPGASGIQTRDFLLSRQTPYH